MYHSREIRWFYKGANEEIERWFNTQGLRFEDIEPRNDHYLIPSLNEDLGIKLREGRIEIKHRSLGPEASQLFKYCEGYFEEWTKWSFGVSTGDNELGVILGGEETSSWVETYKERLAIKLAYDESGELLPYPANRMLRQGCQVEYTRLEVGDTLCYTFGLEWFGSSWINFDMKILQEIIGKTILEKKDSSSYPQFLISTLNL